LFGTRKKSRVWEKEKGAPGESAGGKCQMSPMHMGGGAPVVQRQKNGHYGGEALVGGGQKRDVS